MLKTPEFERAEAAFARELHHADYCKAHPEDLLTDSLHPVMAQAFAPLAPRMFPRPPVFSARVGKRPIFHSSHDAVQYERGFAEFPNQPPGLPDSPRMQGYLDAELAHADALAAKQERRTSDWAELT